MDELLLFVLETIMQTCDLRIFADSVDALHSDMSKTSDCLLGSSELEVNPLSETIKHIKPQWNGAINLV